MPQFSTGDNKGGHRSAKWVPSSYGFEGHVVRTAIGTAEAAEYCHTAADIPWGILANDGTQNNLVTVATEGVINMRNSLNGTVALGDPIILDYTNSGGTTGFVRSGYTSQAIASIAAGGDIGTHVIPHAGLSFKAVPGSVRETGTNSFLVLQASGTVLMSVDAGAFGGGNFYYQIDQPVLGFAKEVATTPRQLFKVEIVKDRFIKNNTVN